MSFLTLNLVELQFQNTSETWPESEQFVHSQFVTQTAIPRGWFSSLMSIPGLYNKKKSNVWSRTLRWIIGFVEVFFPIPAVLSHILTCHVHLLSLFIWYCLQWYWILQSFCITGFVDLVCHPHLENWLTGHTSYAFPGNLRCSTCSCCSQLSCCVRTKWSVTEIVSIAKVLLKS